jgi:hypothetical protein
MLDSEVARLAGLDRQLVRHWAIRAADQREQEASSSAARDLAKQTWKAGHLPKFRGAIVKRGRGKDAAPCHATSGR